MLSMRISRHSVEDIQAHFGIKRSTVYKGLSEARKRGLLTAAADYIHDRLIPKALLVIEEAMEHENYKDVALPAAVAVLKGTILTQRFQMQLQMQPPAAAGAEESFEIYRERIIAQRRTPGHSAGDSAKPDAGTAGDGAATAGTPRLSLPAGEAVLEGEVVRAGDAGAGDAGGTGDTGTRTDPSVDRGPGGEPL